MFEAWSRFRNAAEDWQKVAPFFDNWVSIGYVKMSLLRR